MYVNSTLIGTGIDYGSESNINRSNTTINQDLTTQRGNIELTSCQTAGHLKTTSGNVKLDQGTLQGSISSTSGNALVNRVLVTGSISTESGDIDLRDNSVVYAGNASMPALTTTSGNIQARNAAVQGLVETRSGQITLTESMVLGDIKSEQNAFSIDHSTVDGTLTAVGDSLHIGNFATIDKIVLQAPHTASASVFAGVSRTIVQNDRTINTTNFVGSVVSGSNMTFTDSRVRGGNIVGGKVNIGGGSGSDSNRAQASRIESQTIFLGAGTKVKHIEFEAARCQVILGPGAEYSGTRPDGMTIERESAQPRSQSTSVVQVLNARLGSSAQPTETTGLSTRTSHAANSSSGQSMQLPDTLNFPMDARDAHVLAMNPLVDTLIGDMEVFRIRASDTANSLRAMANVIDTPFSGQTLTALSTRTSHVASPSIADSMKLPDDMDFSMKAQADRTLAMNLLFDIPIANESLTAEENDKSSRREKLSEIGSQYIDGLRGESSDKLQAEILSLDDQSKAKTLAAIIYGTLVEYDLEKSDLEENGSAKSLLDLCEKSIDVADKVKNHLTKLDSTGVSGSGLDVPVTGGVSLLNQGNNWLPYATQKMLETLGIS